MKKPSYLWKKTNLATNNFTLSVKNYCQLGKKMLNNVQRSQ